MEAGRLIVQHDVVCHRYTDHEVYACCRKQDAEIVHVVLINLLPSVYHESHTSGVGLMYRVIDVPGFFSKLAQPMFGTEQLTLRLTIRDSFLPENEGSWLIQFSEGRPKIIVDGEAEVSVSMDISDFSSLVMGAVSFRKLYTYGLVEVDAAEAIAKLDRLFFISDKAGLQSVHLKVYHTV